MNWEVIVSRDSWIHRYFELLAILFRRIWLRNFRTVKKILNEILQLRTMLLFFERQMIENPNGNSVCSILNTEKQYEMIIK